LPTLRLLFRCLARAVFDVMLSYGLCPKSQEHLQSYFDSVHMLPACYWFHALLILRPWRWRHYFSLKCRWTSTRLHSVTSHCCENFKYNKFEECLLPFSSECFIIPSPKQRRVSPSFRTNTVSEINDIWQESHSYLQGFKIVALLTFLIGSTPVTVPNPLFSGFRPTGYLRCMFGAGVQTHATDEVIFS
jgi:hypothetical protein